MNIEKKGIEIAYNSGDYYGCSLHIWESEQGQTREEFVSSLKSAIKDSDWLVNNINIRDFLDFVDTLSNGLNGDDLYKNIIENVYYIKNIETKAYKLGLDDNLYSTVFINVHKYSDSESISLFNKFTPYLKSNDNFIDWFTNELEYENKELFLSIYDDNKSKDRLCAYLKEKMKQKEKDIKYHKQKLKEQEDEYNILNKKFEEINDDANKLEGDK